jgi:hypothetical protein
LKIPLYKFGAFIQIEKDGGIGNGQMGGGTAANIAERDSHSAHEIFSEKVRRKRWPKPRR